MTLLRWPRNLGPKPTRMVLTMVPPPVLVLTLLPMRNRELRPEATTRTAPPKLMASFRLLARWLLLSIRSSMLKTLGPVPLILLNNIMEHGWWCMVLASRLFRLQFMQFGVVLTRWEIEVPLTHLDTLTWITVPLLLNRKLVSVPVSLAPFMLAGLRNRNELAGWPGLETLVCEWCIVLDMVVTVLPRLTICPLRQLLTRSSPLPLFRTRCLMGTLA